MQRLILTTTCNQSPDLATLNASVLLGLRFPKKCDEHETLLERQLSKGVR
jgi:hypothetical protein